MKAGIRFRLALAVLVAVLGVTYAPGCSTAAVRGHVEVIDVDALTAASVVEGATNIERARTRAIVPWVLELARLSYDVSFDTALHPSDDPRLQSAPMEFERAAAGRAMNGVVTLAKFQRLQLFARLQDEARITLPRKFVSGIGGSLVSAMGTWVLRADQIAYPLNTSTIQCWRDSGLCTDFRVYVVLPDYAEAPIQIVTEVESYEITQWSGEEVRALTRSFCRQAELTINARTDTVYRVTTNVTEEGCPVIGRLDQPRLATLEDGRDVARTFFEEREAALGDVTRGSL